MLSARDTRIDVTASLGSCCGFLLFFLSIALISSASVVPRIGPGSLTATGSVCAPAMITGVPTAVMA